MIDQSTIERLAPGMKIQRFNWHIWAGFLLSLVAFISYPQVFVRWAVTRDFPWVNLLLFGVAAALLLVGTRRAWTRQITRSTRITSTALAGLSALVLAFFVFTALISSRWLPESHGAPRVGQKAPDFSLADTGGIPVSLAKLLSSPMDGTTPRGVLLVFYRGYW